MVEMWHERVVHYRSRGKYRYPYVWIRGRQKHLTRAEMAEVVEVEGSGEHRLRTGGYGGYGNKQAKGRKRGVAMISDEEAERKMQDWLRRHPDWAKDAPGGKEEWKRKYPPRIIPEPALRKAPSLQRYIDQYERERSR